MQRGSFLLIVILVVGLLIYAVALGAFNRSRTFSGHVSVPSAQDIYTK